MSEFLRVGLAMNELFLGSNFDFFASGRESTTRLRQQHQTLWLLEERSQLEKRYFSLKIWKCTWLTSISWIKALKVSNIFRLLPKGALPSTLNIATTAKVFEHVGNRFLKGKKFLKLLMIQHSNQQVKDFIQICFCFVATINFLNLDRLIHQHVL